MFYLNIKLIINYNYLCLILNIFRYKYKFLNFKKYNDSLFLIIFLSKAFLGIIKLYLIDRLKRKSLLERIEVLKLTSSHSL